MDPKKQAGEKTRELLDLVVREVSLVDRPANKQCFLLIKRAEDTMGNFTNEEPGMEQGAAVTEAAMTAAQDTSVEKGLPSPELKASIAAALPLLKDKPGAELALQLLQHIAAEGGYPYPAPGGYPYPKPETASAKVPAKKDQEEDKTKVKDDEDVEKRDSKRFTSRRMADMQEALVKLVSVMHGVDSKAVKDALEKAMPKGKAEVDEEEDVQDAKDGKGKGKGKGGGVACAKSEDAELTKAMTDLQKAIGDVATRVEQIEKARNPATGNQGDNTQVAVQKSMWKGVL